MPISAGTNLEDFTAPDETGEPRRLSDFLDKPLVLYFYPKDDTPGCTKEACNFRDDYDAYSEAGVNIVGVSPDSPKSHTKFKEKYHLPFPLLADQDHQITEAFGVWGPKTFMGREYEGVHRTTFIIGPDREVKKVFENVKPAEHSEEILSYFQNRA